MESSTDTGVSTPPAKSRTTAALLALFLGGLGVHKFYLGYTAVGVIFLLINTVGWLVFWIVAFVPNILVWLVCVIECIIYFTKTDEDFHRIYVAGRHSLL